MTRKFNLYRSIDLGFHIKLDNNACNAIYVKMHFWKSASTNEDVIYFVLVTLNYAYAAHPRESS